jgi:wobble nucleotide-excising tRNase
LAKRILKKIKDIEENEKNKKEIEDTIKATKDNKGELLKEKELKEISKEKDKFFTEKAKEIRTTLQLSEYKYNKNNLEQDYEKYLKENPLTIKDEKSSPIEESKRNDAVNLFIKKDTEIQSLIDEYQLLITKYDFDKIIRLLKTTIIRKTKTELKEEIIEWIEKGYKNSYKNNNCPFCGQPIDDEHWKKREIEIKEIINKDTEFEKLENEFNEIKEIINNIRELQSQNNNYSENTFYNKDYFKYYIEKECNLKELIKSYNDYIKQFKYIVKEKEKNKNKTDFDFPDINNIINEIENKIGEINTIIKTNNEELQNLKNNFSEKREQNKQIVINYYIQENLKKIENLNNKIEETRKEKDEVIKENEKNEEKLKSKEKEIQTLKQEMESQKDIIQRINNYLLKILTTRIEIVIDDNEEYKEKYLLKRFNNANINGTNEIAKDLSEGEKNLIAFLYFIILIENETNKKDKIIVIDDPVSSLDSNNIFSIHSILVSILTKKDNNEGEKSKNLELLYGQVFILTHNFYFFTKIRDSLKYRNQGNISYYEIKRIDTSSSTICGASKHLIKHLSDYIGLIEELKEFRKNEEKNIVIGNLIRRVLEIFTAFKIPNEIDFYNRVIEIGNNSDKYKCLYNIANAFSHSNEISSINSNYDYCCIVGSTEIQTLFDLIKK